VRVVVSDPRDRDQFLQLIVRLQAVAEKHGDRVFAAALSECLVDASGGGPGCPMGDLILQQYADTGHMPEIGDATQKSPPLPLNATDPPPYDRQRLLDFIHHILEERAILKGDTHYVQALHGCQRTMQENESCPVHRFLSQHPHP
jgi:hypothetical protein